MLDFANPYYLLILLALPAIWLLYVLSRVSMRRKLRRFGRPVTVRRLMPDVSRYKPALKLTLRLIALAAIVVAIARPRHGEKDETVSSAGSEIVIAFDVSRSMLAPSTDDPGSVARIDRARMLLEKLVGDLSNDKVGLVVFAANARMQMPLTSDHRIIQLAMQNDLTPGMMSNQGTSISQAIEMATMTFPGLRDQMGSDDAARAKADNSNIHRAIVLITDAEDHEGDAVQLAAQAAEQGIQIDVIGVGSEKGGRIPVGPSGQYLRDSEGNEVVTSLNAQAATDIAKAGNGIYVNAADPAALNTLKDSLDKLKKSEFSRITYKMSAEQFPLFAWIALIFLILDLAIVERKTAWLKGVNFFTRHSKK